LIKEVGEEKERAGNEILPKTDKGRYKQGF